MKIAWIFILQPLSRKLSEALASALEFILRVNKLRAYTLYHSVTEGPLYILPDMAEDLPVIDKILMSIFVTRYIFELKKCTTPSSQQSP